MKHNIETISVPAAMVARLFSAFDAVRLDVPPKHMRAFDDFSAAVAELQNQQRTAAAQKAAEAKQAAEAKKPTPTGKRPVKAKTGAK